jgi:hypothetical protein
MIIIFDTLAKQNCGHAPGSEIKRKLSDVSGQSISNDQV